MRRHPAGIDGLNLSFLFQINEQEKRTFNNLNKIKKKKKETKQMNNRLLLILLSKQNTHKNEEIKQNKKYCRLTEKKKNRTEKRTHLNRSNDN